MRAIILAIAASVTIVAFTIFGSVGYCKILENLEVAVASSDTPEDAMRAVDYFSKWEFFLSLGVSDSSLDSLELSLSELTGIDEFDESTDYEATKSRLLCEISQLRRLLGLNLKAIF